MGQLDKDFLEERKFSDPLKWDISIDWDDASDGSEGGYDRHGNYVISTAMQELVALRATVHHLLELCETHGINPTEGLEE